MELSTYFRINEKETGQFERTLIIADKGAYVSYLEGCTAPSATSTSCTQPHASEINRSNDLDEESVKHRDQDELPEAHAGDDRGIGKSGTTRKRVRYHCANRRERCEANAVEEQRVPR